MAPSHGRSSEPLANARRTNTDTVAPYQQAVNDPLAALRLGDMRAVLAAMGPKSVHLAITSPPFYAKRKYANPDEQTTIWGDGSVCALGHEPTPDLFVAHLVECFAAVKRVLRDDGVLVVEIGDSYGAGSRKTDKPQGLQGNDAKGRPLDSRITGFAQTRIGIPERFALAMAADGWRWRDSLIWRHTSAMPESVSGWSWRPCQVKVKAFWSADNPSPANDGPSGINYGRGPGNHMAQWADCPGCPKCEPNGGYVLRRGQWRATVAHSYVYVFSKTASYYGDGEAVRQPYSAATNWAEIYDGHDTKDVGDSGAERAGDVKSRMLRNGPQGGANLRSVLDIGPEPFTLELCAACRHVYKAKHFRRLEKHDGKRVCSCGATEWVSHYATYPTKLPELFIRAFTSEAGCCPKCGAPWARVIERGPLREDPQREGRSVRNAAFDGDGYSDNGGTLGLVAEAKTIGWRATCTCNALYCATCQDVILYNHAEHSKATIPQAISTDLRDLRKGIPGEERCQELQSDMQISNSKTERDEVSPSSSANMRDLSSAIYGTSAQEDLFPTLHQEATFADNIRAVESRDYQAIPLDGRWDETPELEGWPKESTEGLYSSQANGASNGGQEGLGVGTPIDNGRTFGQDATFKRGRSPQEWDQRRQPSGEPSDSISYGAIRSCDLPPLSSNLLGSLACPHCHGILTLSSSIILDPFAGTGSTLVAAQRNGRGYMGIDCSQDYLDLSAARLAETPAALR